MNLKKIKKKERKEKRQQVIKFSKKKSKLNYGGGRCLIIATAVNGWYFEHLVTEFEFT